MAILDLVPGLEVTVCVDDHPLEEYNDDEEVEAQPGEAFQHQASRTVSKYVESITDKEFEIRCNVTSAFNMTALPYFSRSLLMAQNLYHASSDIRL
jgi:hypothetical protein